MAGIKRQYSPDSVGEDERASKLSKPESNNASAVAHAILTKSTDRQVRIDVKLGSTRKGARNDPMPSFSIEDMRKDLENYDSTLFNGEFVQGDDEDQEANECDYNNEDDADEDDDEDDEDDEGDEDDDDDEDDEGDNYSDYGEGHLWLETIRGTALSAQSLSKNSKIGSCLARLIRREEMRALFWNEMEVPSRELSKLAFELFDRYGRLRSDYCDHDVRKGTGVWGKELNYGDLLLFEEIKIDRQWRRQGIARQIVKAILETTRTKVASHVGFFALVRPGYLTREATSAQEPPEKQEEIAQCFWKSLGFRRVGISSWLAFTDSVEHPSRQLELEQDCQKPEAAPEDNAIPRILKELYQKLGHPETDENECISNVQVALSSNLESQKCGPCGDTLLHFAALRRKPELVKLIIAGAPQTVTLRNQEGYTPAEALQRELEEQRTRQGDSQLTRVVSDDFTGYEASAIACLAAFQNFSAVDLSTLSPRDIEAAVAVTAEQISRPIGFDILAIQKTLRLKYGCTCGDCLGGFISPRTKFALLCVAEVQYDMLNDDIGHRTGPQWVDSNNHLLTELPSSVRNNLKTNKSMRQGFTNMINYFAECLRRDRIPSEREVLSVLRSYQSEWPPVTKGFLQRGGSVASVATMIFQTAMYQDKWSGDGHCWQMFAEQIDKLPSCRNDHEFAFVSGTCGYKRVQPDCSQLIYDPNDVSCW
ncbi:hypothetical protein PFICI_02861 [Pestalotiopsis fici W106-1]|uniref:N-acetyltransferase domain-containing protein n=1 Tax=Pestalotiopsis fici (strain W106-1 / CGMCC3.15140) TaxID=1229662 RepID=W3XHY2_PESFW|nr:uncharacterized protein PFICI_02861 [Pestalotiopsis fici W106-1]ETS84836.1 hypothetical protein PFICI_02861 [Pestalotiopsis fici W106-1]